MKKIIVGFYLFILSFSYSFAKNTGMVSLLGIMPARPLSMAESFVAVSDDINSLHFNPAGLSYMRKMEGITSYKQGISDTKYYLIQGGMKTGKIGLAGSLALMDAGKIDIIYWPGFSYDKKRLQQDWLLTAGAGYLIKENISAGASFKLIRSELIEEWSSLIDWAVDIGALYKMNLDMGKISFGFAMRNIGTEVSYEYESWETESDPMPLVIEFGGAGEFKMDAQKMILSATLRNTYGLSVWDLYKLGEFFSFDDLCLLLGGEFWLQNMFALRGGWKIGSDINPFSFGIGFDLNGLLFDYNFSFGLVDEQNYFGGNHSITLGFKFGEAPEEIEKKPEKRQKGLTKREKEQMSIHFMKATELYQEKNYEEAINEWKKLLEINPDHKLSKEKIKAAKKMLLQKPAFKKKKVEEELIHRNRCYPMWRKK